MATIERDFDRDHQRTVYRPSEGYAAAEQQDETTVLVVDDDEHIVELLTLYFEKEHYRVVTCLDGNEAMKC